MSAQPFREGLFSMESQQLFGSRCAACGNTTFPAQRFCPACGSTAEQATVPLSKQGVVYSFTIVRQAPGGFTVPYVLAYVDLPEQVRVMSQLTGCRPDEVSVGMEVDLVLEPIGHADDGTDLIGYRFRPRVPARAGSKGED
ncbi:MAG TPA: Zn-ribbon domain-containing OB-fold protein [Candidatus Sulfotelmatobacter sp.]|nr:Zn-ribbon domain-containing OB-fold protein [Candidatus Sulfotelmatobacter sp.]